MLSYSLVMDVHLLISFVTSTGATGYIGGDVLSTLARAFRGSKISALVRNEARASLITDKFPSVTPVIGDLDSAARISSEASEADVVLRELYVYHFLDCKIANTWVV